MTIKKRSADFTVAADAAATDQRRIQSRADAAPSCSSYIAGEILPIVGG